jgi:hypothetical protein
MRDPLSWARAALGSPVAWSLLFVDKAQNRALAKVLSEDYELWKRSGKVAVYRLR